MNIATAFVEKCFFGAVFAQNVIVLVFRAFSYE